MSSPSCPAATAARKLLCPRNCPACGTPEATAKVGTTASLSLREPDLADGSSSHISRIARNHRRRHRRSHYSLRMQGPSSQDQSPPPPRQNHAPPPPSFRR